MVVSELREEMAEHERQAQDPERIPVLQVKRRRLLLRKRPGPSPRWVRDSGAGKYWRCLERTVQGSRRCLRVVAGLGTPSRGVVRLNGRTITYVSPEQRTKLGIHMLPGGKSVFPTMTVAQNLEMGAYAYRKDRDDRDRRIARVLGLFPVLAAKRLGPCRFTFWWSTADVGAGESALARSGDPPHRRAVSRTCPVAVQELLAVLERLRDEGLTIVVVEQSVDVALSIADGRCSWKRERSDSRDWPKTSANETTFSVPSSSAKAVAED